jgi:hypothetical protein
MGHPARQAAEKGLSAGEFPEEQAAGAKAHVDSIGLLPGINPRPTARLSFSAACKARLPICEHFAARLKSCPVTKLSSMKSLRQAETFACHESSNAIPLSGGDRSARLSAPLLFLAALGRLGLRGFLKRVLKRNNGRGGLGVEQSKYRQTARIFGMNSAS